MYTRDEVAVRIFFIAKPSEHGSIVGHLKLYIEETSQNISGTCKTDQTRGKNKQKPTTQNPETKTTASARVG